VPATGKIRATRISLPQEHTLPQEHLLRLVERIRKGIPARTYTLLAQRLGIPKKELAIKLRISPRTIQDKHRKKLSAQESEKMLRVDQIFEEAKTVLGTTEGAKDWIKSPQRGLEFRKPLDLLDTDVGASYVRDLLSAIKYGNVW